LTLRQALLIDLAARGLTLDDFADLVIARLRAKRFRRAGRHAQTHG